jgi:hypothetical protein
MYKNIKQKKVATENTNFNIKIKYIIPLVIITY